MTIRKSLLTSAAAAITMAVSSIALAVPLQITVTNNQFTGGFAFTPVYFGFTDGSFDAFDVGSAASSGTELIAEIGVFNDPGDTIGPDTLAEERLAADPDSRGAMAVADESGAPVFEPGESVTITVDVDPTTQRYVQFLSMLLPSNDTFFGNDDPVALFDEFGNFNGEQSFEINASNLYDAGTEENDLGNGPAFVDEQVGTDGNMTNGVITGGVTLESLGIDEDITLATGDVLNLVLAEKFFAGQSSLATITFDLAPNEEVPIPAAAFLFAPLAAGFALARRKRKA